MAISVGPRDGGTDGVFGSDNLDHVIVLGERHLRRVGAGYVRHYNRSRTHLGLAKDAPEGRPIQRREVGPVVAVPEVGGLHHRYERRAA